MRAAAARSRAAARHEMRQQQRAKKILLQQPQREPARRCAPALKPYSDKWRLQRRGAPSAKQQARGAPPRCCANHITRARYAVERHTPCARLMRRLPLVVQRSQPARRYATAPQRCYYKHAPATLMPTPLTLWIYAAAAAAVRRCRWYIRARAIRATSEYSFMRHVFARCAFALCQNAPLKTHVVHYDVARRCRAIHICCMPPADERRPYYARRRGVAPCRREYTHTYAALRHARGRRARRGV